MSAQSAALVDRLVVLLEAKLGLSCVAWQRTRLVELAGGLAARLLVDRPELGDADPPAALHLSRHDLQAIIDQINVGETYFFRESAHFAALLDPALRERLPKSEPGHPLRILSAGCASGEEAYSIAITLRQYREEFATGRIEILGVDVHAAALAKARRARYSAWSLRATSPALRSECFSPDGDSYRLRDSLRNLVRFEEHNLLEPAPGFFRPAAFDVIFCRNVLIYFSDRSLRLAVDRLVRALLPGGYLFLGHSESLRGISDAVTLCQVNDAFFYKKPEAANVAVPVPSANVLPPEAKPAEASAQPAHAEPAENDPAWSTLMPVLLQIASEQFGKAQELLAALQSSAAPRTAVLLAVATNLCGQSLTDEAIRACQRLLADSEYQAEAHYLLALCAEQKDDPNRARREYQQAIRLAPRFAMAHLRLGTLLRRTRGSARAALRQAVELLPQETPVRVLLFGGGFPRDALIAMCRAQLSTLGADG